MPIGGNRYPFLAFPTAALKIDELVSERSDTCTIVDVLIFEWPKIPKPPLIAAQCLLAFTR
jgi:hypothetical protein